MHEWWRDDQALAYAIVEQGRLSCEELRQDAGDGRTADRLGTAHAGFGMAAYTASDHLLDGVRPALHLLVGQAGPVALPAPTPLSRALLFAVHGAAAIERCFATPWLVAQMQAAHRSVRQAHRALTSLIGVPLTAQLTIEATRLGHLDASWQRVHLRPPSLATVAAQRGLRAPAPV
jgi:hypothetical protein